MELQTERMQHETGAKSIESLVHFHNRASQQRFVTLVSDDGHGNKKPQSLAYTRLMTKLWDPSMLAIDKLLERNKLMGQTFKQAGYEVYQNRLLRIRLPLLNRSIARYYNCRTWTSIEIECYEFWANDKLYGIVLEIKNPQRREAPHRPKKGYYRIHQLGEQRQDSLILLFCAKIVGVAISLRLCARCLIHSKRYIR